MNITIQELAEKLDRLRADLSATNLALAATTTVLTKEQRQDLLRSFAQASAQKQSFFDQLPMQEAEARAAGRLFQQAEDRVYQLLQAAPEQFGKG